MAARGGAYDHEKFRRQVERETARERAARDREERAAYLTSRLDEAAELSDASAHALEELDGLLVRSLSEPVAPVDFAVLKRSVPSVSLDLGADAEPGVEREWERYAPAAPGRLGQMLGGVGRYERAIQEARERFADAVALHDETERERLRRVAAARSRHEQRQAEAARRVEEANTEIDRIVAGVADRDRYAVSEYFQRVVDATCDPDRFPRARRCAYVPESNLLVVEWDLPGMDVVPEHGEFKYVKTRDEIDAKPVPVALRRSAYRRLIAQVALRCLRLVFGTDPGDLVDTVVFNGMIDEVDPATGLDVRPCLITLRATRDQFAPVRLDRVKPVNCIRDHFAADVSEHPEELRAVEPVLTFDMADPRVIEPIDVLSGIDRRPNLLDLSPTEFEHFVQNLFAKMGLEVQVFRPGGDAGIDCVVHDTTSIFGGKYCIQAKLYRKTVPPTAVRDLFGAVSHEGATKGILITTSGFSKATYTWAKGKPLELIDGTGLLYHCNRVGIPARILRGRCRPMHVPAPTAGDGRRARPWCLNHAATAAEANQVDAVKIRCGLQAGSCRVTALSSWRTRPPRDTTCHVEREAQLRALGRRPRADTKRQVRACGAVWGSRGRRFKSCRPDGERAGQGRCDSPALIAAHCRLSSELNDKVGCRVRADAAATGVD